MPSTVVVGGFFGDEGKGKIISYLSKKDNPSIVVRGGAGPNAAIQSRMAVLLTKYACYQVDF